mmetsp:Transcript_36482/g.101268  ORF Transcript_36482/g.101268 Transcript_36482/m.101268 type:complete len:393 (-) Transcript_36482:1388-2566(-)
MVAQLRAQDDQRREQHPGLLVLVPHRFSAAGGAAFVVLLRVPVRGLHGRERLPPIRRREAAGALDAGRLWPGLPTAARAGRLLAVPPARRRPAPAAGALPGRLRALPLPRERARGALAALAEKALPAGAAGLRAHARAQRRGGLPQPAAGGVAAAWARPVAGPAARGRGHGGRLRAAARQGPRLPLQRLQRGWRRAAALAGRAGAAGGDRLHLVQLGVRPVLTGHGELFLQPQRHDPEAGACAVFLGQRLRQALLRACLDGDVRLGLDLVPELGPRERGLGGQEERPLLQAALVPLAVGLRRALEHRRLDLHRLRFSSGGHVRAPPVRNRGGECGVRAHRRPRRARGGAQCAHRHLGKVLRAGGGHVLGGAHLSPGFHRVPHGCDGPALQVV